jgi:hypothetical protein
MNNYCTRYNKRLTSMDYNLIFMANFLVHKEGSYIRTLVSRQLDDLSQLWILCDAPVALECLL